MLIPVSEANQHECGEEIYTDTYDCKREAILGIDELHVLAGEGDEHNFYTENTASKMPTGNHGCKNERYNSAGYVKSSRHYRHYYDIPYMLKYVINLYYRARRYECISCNLKFVIPTTFADERSKAHYTYRFEKWVAQQCLVYPFSKAAEKVMEITPSALNDAEK